MHRTRSFRAARVAMLLAMLFCGRVGLADSYDVPATPCQVITTQLRDLTGIRILHTTYDNFAGAPATLIGDLESRGAVVDVLDYTTNPYRRLDDSYDILFLHAIGSVPVGQDLADLLAWVRSGGKSILFEGVSFWLIDTANILSDSLDAGWECRSIGPGPGIITDIVDHPITADVCSLEQITAHYTEFAIEREPAGVLFRCPEGEIVGAYTTPGNARIVYLGASLFWDNRIDLADNRRIGNQAIDWLAENATTFSIRSGSWTAMKNAYRHRGAEREPSR